ncbi:hypothetical protein DFH07DRAFT_774065 [Mycena maculata]|uniref:Uncharacterized protein n=1 Tax=Mycena maculata TaxID=230809 RepID=A0AAD7NBE8_9AGAR|nr:hypothetical protein DFH07DRAFT_774065 [Mycena maculata]
MLNLRGSFLSPLFTVNSIVSLSHFTDTLLLVLARGSVEASARRAIKSCHLDRHPGIAEDAKFHLFFAHRSRVPKAGSKTSADKTAEEEVKVSEPIKATTGVNRALLQLKVKMDPPAPLTKLVWGGYSDLSDTESAVQSKGTPEPEFNPE